MSTAAILIFDTLRGRGVTLETLADVVATREICRATGDDSLISANSDRGSLAEVAVMALAELRAATPVATTIIGRRDEQPAEDDDDDDELEDPEDGDEVDREETEPLKKNRDKGPIGRLKRALSNPATSKAARAALAAIAANTRPEQPRASASRSASTPRRQVVTTAAYRVEAPQSFAEPQSYRFDEKGTKVYV